jgi:methanethiol S-methyltransferase
MSDALIIAAAVIAYGILHSLLASSAAKRWLRGLLGPGIDRFYRLGYNAVAIISFLPVLALLAWRPGPVIYRLHSPWDVLALAMQALAAALLAVGLVQTDAWSFLGLRQLARQPQPPARLITNGLYRWVRHPLYTAGLLILWLTPILTSGLLALNLMLTVYILIGSRLEERRLVAEFGEAYQAYQRRVPSLLPLRRPRD